MKLWGYKLDVWKAILTDDNDLDFILYDTEEEARENQPTTSDDPVELDVNTLIALGAIKHS